MLITNASTQALRVGFSALYQSAFDAVPKNKDRVATTIKSTTATNLYGWMKTSTGLREWVGPRVIDNLSEASYTIVNKAYEKTVAVNRNQLEDDQLGVFKLDFSQLGYDAAMHPEELVFNLLAAGFTTTCFDGQNYFDTDHPIMLKDGTMGTYANTDGGSGAPWFLLCTKRPLKPIIYQERKAPAFVARDKETDDNVFDRNELVYGVDMRCNVGFGLPQLAWGSKQTLNAANYEIARAAIINMKGDGGKPLGLTPDLLVVGATLEGAARGIVQSLLVNGGESNKWAGTAEVLVSSFL